MQSTDRSTAILIEYANSKTLEMATNNLVAYWDEPYVHQYTGHFSEERYLSQVDSQVLYEALDSLAVKVTGETTGVNGIDWFKSLDPPDIRNPFRVMVHLYIQLIVL